MKAQLEALVGQMHRSGIIYAEAVQEFRKIFITTALRENRWNRSKTACAQQMHRNTLSRITAELHIEFPHFRHGAQRASQELPAQNAKKRSA